MDACNCKQCPGRNVYGMVADLFEVLGDHEEVEDIFNVGVLGEAADQLLLGADECLVDDIVHGNGFSGKVFILDVEGGDGIGHHLGGRICHLLDIDDLRGCGDMFIDDDVRNVGRDNADPLQIIDGLQYSAYVTQIAGDRLLLKKKLEAEVFNFPFFTARLRFETDNASGKLCVVFHQCGDGAVDGQFALTSHVGNGLAQRCQLIIKMFTHKYQPNLPVM